MRERKGTKHIFLCAVISFLLVLCITGITQTTKSYAATVANPRVSNGTSTWDCVWFGKYYQSDALEQEKDPIKWRVLSVDGNDAFLIADQNLDTKPYNTTQTNVTWESCTL